MMRCNRCGEVGSCTHICRQDVSGHKPEMELSRAEVMQFAIELNNPVLYKLTKLYELNRITWEQAMQGAAIHLAKENMQQHVALLEPIQTRNSVTPDKLQVLAKFYAVSSTDELITAMENHILRLQAKVPAISDAQPRRVREG